VSIQYDYTGQQVAKYVAAEERTTRYFNELAEGRDGKLVKSYFAGDLRIASSENTAWGVAGAAVGDAKMLASLPTSAAVRGSTTSAAVTATIAMAGVGGASV
jgi:hypothetical protein